MNGEVSIGQIDFTIYSFNRINKQENERGEINEVK